MRRCTLSIVRGAFQVAQQERPGPVHLELPEDIAGEAVPAIPPVPSHPIDPPVASRAALDRAAELILKAERPLVMLGAAASRPRLAESLSDFTKRLQLPFFRLPGAVFASQAPIITLTREGLVEKRPRRAPLRDERAMPQTVLKAATEAALRSR